MKYSARSFELITRTEKERKITVWTIRELFDNIGPNIEERIYIAGEPISVHYPNIETYVPRAEPSSN